MKFYAVKNKVTGEFVKLGRNKRDQWKQFPTNVMRWNIPKEQLSDYEVHYFDLQQITPLRKYNSKGQIIKNVRYEL